MQAANLFNEIEDWWQPNGSLRSLHWINPARLQYAQQQLCCHFNREPIAQPYTGLKILDIGCGGGLVCEPLARLGGQVTGIDLSETAIATAQAHAQAQGLTIDYRCVAAETLLSSSVQSAGDLKRIVASLDSRTVRADNNRYDVVLALDLLEHVNDPAAIIHTIAQLTRPGGLVILSTINRSWQAWLGAIKLAENVFKFVPKGAHAYRQLIKPEELAGYCEAAGLTIGNLCGIIPKPRLGGIDFILSPQHLGVNYLLAAAKPA